MLALGIDTATPATSTAVVALSPERVTLRAERRQVAARGHAELLGPQVAEVLAVAGARPADLAAVVAGTGPGPFTGLRVGLATAAAIGQALAIPTYGVCSLDAIAEPDQEQLLVVTDARRREVYWAVYGPGGARVVGPAVDRPAVVAKEAALLGIGVAVGEGAHRYRDELGLEVLLDGRYPSAYRLVALAADRIRAGGPGERLVPRYLRRPDVAEPRPGKPVTPR